MKDEDLIFAAGVPGSRWSRILHTISLNEKIDSSDILLGDTYSSQVNLGDSFMRVGQHSGVYFGPGNTYGEQFDDLTKLTKEEFKKEISKVFTGTGKKIVKSHWFCSKHNLEWLKNNFPNSTILFIYNPSRFSLLWWHAVGGWNIPFPDYSWYKDNRTMYIQMINDNVDILNFISENKLSLRYIINPSYLYHQLGLTITADEEERLVPALNKSAIAVWSPQMFTSTNNDYSYIFTNASRINKSLRSSEIILEKFGAGYLLDLEQLIDSVEDECSHSLN
jgi:hypothetical protein